MIPALQRTCSMLNEPHFLLEIICDGDKNVDPAMIRLFFVVPKRGWRNLGSDHRWNGSHQHAGWKV